MRHFTPIRRRNDDSARPSRSYYLYHPSEFSSQICHPHSRPQECRGATDCDNGARQHARSSLLAGMQCRSGDSVSSAACPGNKNLAIGRAPSKSVFRTERSQSRGVFHQLPELTRPRFGRINLPNRTRPLSTKSWQPDPKSRRPSKGPMSLSECVHGHPSAIGALCPR
jgi:hypothetical protein